MEENKKIDRITYKALIVFAIFVIATFCTAPYVLKADMASSGKIERVKGCQYAVFYSMGGGMAAVHAGDCDNFRNHR